MTIPHFGKREPGSLTAANPGDTLYFAWGAYNDSGDSEAASGFAVTDIEVFKNGLPTARATDSGYSLISDTGQMGDRVGLNRFSVQLFNTSDDAGFYAVGSWYQVAVDAVAIDGKTVRFWAGSFEIGYPAVDVTRIAGDTGAADQVGKAFATTPAYFQQVDLQRLDADTGAATHLQQAFAAQATNSDTGLIADAAAIRVKADSLTFTQAGAVDANVTHVNETAVGGTGASGDEWGPA